MTKQKQVLGIVGSPRRGGNTEVLVDEVLRGAQEAGAITEKVILSNLHIEPCLACDTCYQTGACVHDDDMAALRKQMEASDIWVFGTPVYWWGPTAQFKTFMDRWYQGPRELRQMFEGRPIILAIPLEASDACTARHVVGMFTDALAYVKADIVATLIATGVLEKGAVKGHPDYLAAAYKAGLEAARK